MSIDQKIEKLEAVIGMMLLAFPDETIRDGQRFRKDQVRRLNRAIVDAKAYVEARNA